MISRIVLTLLLCGLAPAALAAELPYRYLDLAYAQDDYDYIDARGERYTLSGAYALGPVVLLGSYMQAQTRPFTAQASRGTVDSSQLTIGLGLRLPLSPHISLFPSLQFQQSRADYRGGFARVDDSKDDGYQAEARLRGALAPQLESFAGYRRNRIYERDDDSLFLGAIYYPIPRLGLRLQYSRTDLGRDYATARSDKFSAVEAALQLNLR